MDVLVRTERVHVVAVHEGALRRMLLAGHAAAFRSLPSESTRS